MRCGECAVRMDAAGRFSPLIRRGREMLAMGIRRESLAMSSARRGVRKPATGR